MCGICGHLSLNEHPAPSPEVLEQMVAALLHRGPDGRGLHIDGPLGLGHARLSIIDLAGGDQPMFNEDRSVSLVCNGEIYNYRELRKELLAKGHAFRSQSDSEVILHLWEDEGSRCLKRLRGMFAFVLYDSRRRVLFGARDHFGQKPLFYHYGPRLFAFASEIKSLLPLADVRRRLDPRALDQFLFYQFVPPPRTLFQDVNQLPPGHCFTLEDGRLTVERYWEPTFDPQDAEPETDCLNGLEEALIDAVESHLVSDVPVGLFLSGGVDSSLIAAFASRVSSRPLRTYSIAFRGTEWDESPYARLAAEAFGTEHQEFSFQPGNIEECLQTVATIFDQPIADRAVMPLLFLSEHAAREVKVVLTGDGGDELFGGYGKYRRAATAYARSRLLQRLGRRLTSAPHLAACAPDPLGLKKAGSRLGLVLAPTRRSAYYRTYWEGWDRHRLYSRMWAETVRGDFLAFDAAHADANDGLDPVNAMLRTDQVSYLPDDLLTKTDRATMAYGLEARAPFLDPRLAAVAARLPVHLKVTPAQTKVALRRIAERWLPKELVERPKQGFTFPIKRWFQNELRTWVRDCLLERSTTAPLYFQREHIERVLNEHESGKRDHRGRIYSLLVFELWHRQYMA